MKKITIGLIHGGYWTFFGILLLTLFFFIAFAPSEFRSDPSLTNGLFSWIRLMTGFALIPGVLSFYISYSYLFDLQLSKRRFLHFLISGVSAAFLAAMVGAGFASLPFLFGPAYLFGDGLHSAVIIILMMTALAWVNGINGAVIKGFVTWYNELRLKEELHRKNLETELALVKSQIDPHFLFNTLNNIDTLIIKHPETASVYLNKLSGIIRFLLYETRGEKVDLERELIYLQQYIDLQKIRTSNTGYVQFEFKGNPAGLGIAPMVLLPFVENAFKHTDNRKTTSRIRINLRIEKRKLIFSCINTLIPSEAETPNNGLGNILIKKRLDLLYPGSHTLTINTEDQLYHVNLELDL